jgi:hypothetical protein
MKDFLDIEDKIWNEVYVTYGKDYCAQMGWLMWHDLDKPKNALVTVLDFPFSKVLLRWTKRLKYHQDNTSSHADDNKTLATVGLYEGEHLLFSRISSGDIETVKWLFHQEAQRKRSTDRNTSNSMR